MHALELKIPPLLLLGIFAAAMYGVASVLPQWGLPLAYRLPLALFCALAGASITALGAWAFIRQGTTLKPMQPGMTSHVVENGIFAYSRNPMYLGFVLLLGAWALYLAHPLAALGVPGFVAWVQVFQIQPEELLLLEKFGSAYARYLQRVRRWV